MFSRFRLLKRRKDSVAKEKNSFWKFLSAWLHVALTTMHDMALYMFWKDVSIQLSLIKRKAAKILISKSGKRRCGQVWQCLALRRFFFPSGKANCHTCVLTDCCQEAPFANGNQTGMKRHSFYYLRLQCQLAELNHKTYLHLEGFNLNFSELKSQPPIQSSI